MQKWNWKKLQEMDQRGGVEEEETVLIGFYLIWR